MGESGITKSFSAVGEGPVDVEVIILDETEDQVVSDVSAYGSK